MASAAGKLVLANALLLGLAACGRQQEQQDKPQPLHVGTGDVVRGYAQRFESGPVGKEARRTLAASELVIDATVMQVEFIGPGRPVLIVASADESSIRAEAASDARLAAAELAIGETTTLQCRGVTEVAGKPMLLNCSLR